MKPFFSILLFLLSINVLFAQRKPDGPYKDYFKSGELKIEGQYLNKKRVGDWKAYHKNGQVSRSYSYKKGKLNREEISYFKNGVVSNKTEKVGEVYLNSGYYKSGNLKYIKEDKTGYYKSYYESGVKEIEANYVNYELVGEWKKYRKNGELEWSVSYKDGYRDGDYKQFYDNGDLKLEGNNSRAKVNGEEKRYRLGNILEWQGHYKAGVLNKTWTKFNVNGDIIEKVKFKNGKASKSSFQDMIKPTKVPEGVFEHVPIFPGCEDLLTNSKRKKCMSKNVSELVAKNFNQDLMSEIGLLPGKHRIFLSFKIDKKGNLKDIKARASRIELQVEAVRVIKMLPQLHPGYQRGKAVIVPFSLPIVFQVADKSKRKN